jgi:hypothetical protein
MKTIILILAVLLITSCAATKQYDAYDQKRVKTKKGYLYKEQVKRINMALYCY